SQSLAIELRINCAAFPRLGPFVSWLWLAVVGADGVSDLA
ncbi:MAG: hypothetical protein QG550_806, partial [Pseudomonadota bacterium]|nr:hypothetical protein [Pseudomonadota bacterium]